VTTATQWLGRLADEYEDRPAIVEPDGAAVSFGALEDRVSALAGGLQSLGLGRGDRLAAFVPNGVLPIELLLAAARLGAVTVGVNTRYRAEDLRHLVDRARPRLLVGGNDFLGIDFRGVVGAALERMPGAPTVLWPTDVDDLRRASPPVSRDRASPEDLLVAFSTSGTTGRPKLAAHDHATTIRHLQATARSQEVGIGSTALLTLPFCGTFGFVSAMAVLAGGGRVIVPSHFVPAVAAELIERYGVTHLNGSDDMLLAVLDMDRNLTSWRHGVHAEFTGRGLDCVAAAEAVGARLTGVYGSSETFALLARWSTQLPTGERARNGGVLVDHSMQVRAVDSATGRPVAFGVAGELQLRGPSVLTAYLEEDGTAPPALTPDGWFPTGDLGVVEGDRQFVYLTRFGDALRLAGFLTDPAEIEQHLLEHPAVTGAQVVGVRSERGREVAVAFVTVSTPTEEGALLAHCATDLANYKVPVRIVTLEGFPLVDGPNGVKIRRAELRARAGALGL
jgi:acyl-CoA synthetase (AMP-forming)/AMP-acid ligase II